MSGVPSFFIGPHEAEELLLPEKPPEKDAVDPPKLENPEPKLGPDALLLLLYLISGVPSLFNGPHEAEEW
jgi:hypothetical protein